MRVFTTFITIKIRNRVYPKALVNALLKVKENFCDFGNFQEKGFFLKTWNLMHGGFSNLLPWLNPIWVVFETSESIKKTDTISK